MNDAALKAALEREEQVYEELMQVRASLGTMLAETIKRDKDLSEFEQHKRDLAILTRSTDIRRTELKVELLSRELKKAKEEHRRAIEAAKRATATLEEARKSYARAARGERKWGPETQRLEELHGEEMSRLEQLRSEEEAVPEERSSEEAPGEPAEAAEGEERVEPRTPADAPPDDREYAVTPTAQPGRDGPQPSVEGAQEPRESPESLGHRDAHTEAAGEPQEHTERPWWRRRFEA